MESAVSIAIRSESEVDLSRSVQEFLDKIGLRQCICFWGGLGVGKTTFIRALCKHLGVKDIVTSPTFSLINEYHRTGGGSVYHFDFYRLTRLQEAEDIGVSEYFENTEALCLIEWPALVESLLPEECLHVTLTVEENGERQLTIGIKE
jgi:hydrolase, P-loop family